MFGRLYKRKKKVASSEFNMDSKSNDHYIYMDLKKEEEEEDNLAVLESSMDS